jgi:hypothetical protein
MLAEQCRRLIFTPEKVDDIMHSAQVNASQLLASFLGSENEKISQTVTRSDFAGELKKFIKETPGGTGGHSKRASAKSENVSTLESDSSISGAETGDAGTTKTRGSSTGRVHKGATEGKGKTNGQKAKSKAAESVFATNAAYTSTILADLQYPAETREVCKTLQNNEGSISVKQLKTLIETQTPVTSAIPAQVPAEHVREFVNSIVSKGSGTNEQGSVQAEAAGTYLKVKTEGSYTREEFLGLLDKVVQQAESTQSTSTDAASSSVSTQTAKAAAVNLKSIQTQSIAASHLPSFVSEDSKKSWANTTLAMEAKNPVPEERSINVSNGSDDSIEVDPDKLKSLSTPTVAKTVAAGYQPEGAATVGTAGNEGGGAGSAQDIAAVLSSARQKSTDVSAVALDAMLQNFDARIVSTDPQQGEAKTAEAPAPGGAVEGSVAQAQNLAANVKGAEKTADRTSGATTSSRLSQEFSELHDTGQIKTEPAEYPSSEGSFDGEPNGRSDSTQKNETQTAAAKFDLKETTVTGEVTKNADVKAALRQSNEIPDKTVGKAVQAETRSTVEQTVAQFPDATANETGKAVSALVGGDQTQAGEKMAVQAGSTSEALRVGRPLKDFETEADDSAYGKGSNSGISVHESISSTTGVNPLKAADSHIALSVEDAALLSKVGDKQLGGRDSVPEAAVFQNSASSFQGSEINVSEMGSSAQSGSYYDPNHFSDLVQGMRDQFTSTSGRQLVLETEPAELGKINLKVEAKKDEISVVALTNNESARQALVKHSYELRQDLQDQGLVLDKFMVDVNSDKSGGGKYPEDNQPQGKNLPASKATRTGSIETVPGTAYVIKTDGQSQINIFA